MEEINEIGWIWLKNKEIEIWWKEKERKTKEEGKIWF